MSGSIHRRAPLLGILALAVAGIGVTQVSGAIPNNGVYNACLTKSTGAVKVINYPKVKCAKGQRLIRWGQQGPAGPQGAAGAQGAQGPQGPAGPADWYAIPNKPGGFADGVDNEGVTSVRIRTVTSTTPVNINAGNSGMDTADCPAGFLAVGGGHQETILPILTPSLAFIESRALDEDTWIVHANNLSALDGATLRAQVTCLRAEPGGLTLAAKNSKYGPKHSKVRKPK